MMPKGPLKGDIGIQLSILRNQCTYLVESIKIRRDSTTYINTRLKIILGQKSLQWGINLLKELFTRAFYTLEHIFML
jgi:hypothetical protein